METWRRGEVETLSHRDMETWRHGDMETWTWTWRIDRDIDMENGKQKIEAQVIFLNPFTVCSSCKQKFVICPFVDEETNESCLFTNGLNGLK
jgi:hypothetical protein